ncbi:MAG: ABC transporter ATP-binding protein/permease [Treponema sp.]|nr:ABC transporter ATP-binding protein/permease [Treponema sp.]
MKTKKRWILFIGFTMVLYSIWGIVWASYSKYVFDSIGNADVSVIKVVAIGIIILITGGVSLALRNLVIDLFVKKISVELNYLFIDSLLGHSAQKVAELGEGKILTNFTTDINSVSDMIRNGIQLIRIPLDMLLASAYLIYTNPVLGIIIIALLPPVTLIGRKIGNSLEIINRKYLTRNDSQLKIINRIIKAINVIKTYASEKQIKHEFNQITADKYELEKKQVKYNALFSGVIDICMGAPYTVVFILGAVLFQSQHITVGTLTLFLQLLNSITTPFTRFNMILLQYKQTKVSFDRLNDILTVSGGDNDLPEHIRITPEVIQSIHFDQVRFKYHERFIIDNLNLWLNSGRHYAIIGENGSGKTTFMKLLLNLLSPDSGAILANDYAYTMLRFQDIRKDNKIVYIEDTSCTLFDDFDQNIILDKAMDDGLYMEALKTVGLFDMYEELKAKSPDELSAGQKQRVSLARGLYHVKPGSLLVMDEPFSALDANGCSQMYANIAIYKKRYDLTILEITHNMTDMNRFDYIYYFEDGKVVLEGSHAALMEESKYRRYVENYNREKHIS